MLKYDENNNNLSGFCAIEIFKGLNDRFGIYWHYHSSLKGIQIFFQKKYYSVQGVVGSNTGVYNVHSVYGSSRPFIFHGLYSLQFEVFSMQYALGNVYLLV